MCRLAYIHKTVLAGSKGFIHTDDRRQKIPVAPLLLSHLVNISSSATLDSIRLVQAEITTAEVTLSALLDALKRFTKGNRTRHRCAMPRVKDVCPGITALWSGEDHIQTVRNDLARVSQVLEIAAQGLSAVGEGRNAVQPAVIDASIGVDTRKLEESIRKLSRCSWFARQARKFAAAILEAART